MYVIGRVSISFELHAPNYLHRLKKLKMLYYIHKLGEIFKKLKHEQFDFMIL